MFLKNIVIGPEKVNTVDINQGYKVVKPGL
jgi:hypothetical protein